MHYFVSGSEESGVINGKETCQKIGSRKSARIDAAGIEGRHGTPLAWKGVSRVRTGNIEGYASLSFVAGHDLCSQPRARLNSCLI